MSGANFKLVISKMSSRAGSRELPEMMARKRGYGPTTCELEGIMVRKTFGGREKINILSIAKKNKSSLDERSNYNGGKNCYDVKKHFSNGKVYSYGSDIGECRNPMGQMKILVLRKLSPERWLRCS